MVLTKSAPHCELSAPGVCVDVLRAWTGREGPMYVDNWVRASAPTPLAQST